METNPNTEPEVVETEQVEAAPAPEQAAAQPKYENEPNWKQLRAKADEADKLKRERDEAYAILQQLEQQARSQQRAAPQEEEFDIDRLDDDQPIEAKHLKNMYKKERRERQQLEENLARQSRISNESNIQQQMRRQNPDFDDVMTKQNLEALRDSDPDLADSIAYNPDPAKAYRAAYNAIKRYGIYEEQKTLKMETDALKKNLTKPRSVNTVAPQQKDSALNSANAFSGKQTDEYKQELMKKMRESMERVGNTIPYI